MHKTQTIQSLGSNEGRYIKPTRDFIAFSEDESLQTDADAIEPTLLNQLKMSLLDKISLAILPTGIKTGKLATVIPPTVDAMGEVERNSTATYFDKQGVTQTAPVNQVRTEYDENGDPYILVEPLSTNYYLNSNDFTDSNWQKIQTGSSLVPVVTSNYGIGIDGNQSADRVQLSCGPSFADRSILRQLRTANNTHHTQSFYIKSTPGAGNQSLCFHFNGANQTVFNVNENSWSLVRYSDIANTTLFSGIELRGTITDETADILICCAQLEELPFGTSDIPTTGAIATRLADSLTGFGTVNEFNSSEGVLFLEAAALANDGTSRRISISDNSSANRLELIYSSSSNTIQYSVVVSGSSQVSISKVVSNIEQFNKIALKWKDNDFSIWINGVEQGTDGSGVSYGSSVLTSLKLETAGGGLNFYGKIKQLLVFNQALTDQELQTLTTL